MLKKLMIALIISVPYVCADWLDELSNLIEDKQELELSQALAVIEKYISNDKSEIVRLENAVAEKKESGFWGSLRGGTYSVQLTATKLSLKYYEKVEKFIKELPVNKREREKFTEQLKLLQKLYLELARLKEDYSKADGYGQKISAGAYVGAKEIQIKSRKAFIKSSFLL